MAQDKTNLYLVGIVGIVAVVGLVVMLTGNKSKVIQPTYSEQLGLTVTIGEDGLIYDETGRVIGDANEGELLGKELVIEDDENLIGDAKRKKDKGIPPETPTCIKGGQVICKCCAPGRSNPVGDTSRCSKSNIGDACTGGAGKQGTCGLYNSNGKCDTASGGEETGGVPHSSYVLVCNFAWYSNDVIECNFLMV